MKIQNKKRLPERLRSGKAFFIRPALKYPNETIVFH